MNYIPDMRYLSVPVSEDMESMTDGMFAAVNSLKASIREKGGKVT